MAIASALLQRLSPLAMRRSLPWLSALLMAPLLMLVLALSAPGAQAQSPQSYVREGFNNVGAKEGRYWVDINNDARDDLCFLVDNTRLDCYLSDGAVLASSPVSFGQVGWTFPETVRWVDQNGDGKVDFCKVAEREGGAGFAVECRLGTDFLWGTVSDPVGPTHVRYMPFVNRPGPVERGDFTFADLDGDNRTDYCVLIKTGGGSSRIECTMASTGGFTLLPNWGTVALSDVSIEDLRKGGFHDVNGDGYQDYCFIWKNATRCLLGTKNGPFTGGESRSTDLGPGNEESGSAFIDINGDGKTDYCRATNTSGQRRIACRLSMGLGWLGSDVVTEPTDTGWFARWWVDVNGDGNPDYCRAVGGGNPHENEWQNSTNSMLCRLTSGDAQVFANSDVQLHWQNFGIPDTGRGFCDMFGNGVSTFCRITMRTEEIPNTETCNENGCWNQTREVYGVIAGFPDQRLPEPPLLTQFSDGVGAETRIGYAPMSSSRVYYRSGYGEASAVARKDGSLILQPRQPVVFETRAWREGTNQRLTGNARYYYKDLRHSPLLGSQGFAERWMLTEGTNSIEHLAYFQGLGNRNGLGPGPSGNDDVDGSTKGDYREVGQMRIQRRFAMTGSKPGQVPGSQLGTALGHILNTIAATPSGGDLNTADYLLTQLTVNRLGDTVPANPRMRFATTTTTDKWDLDGATRVRLPLQTVRTTVDVYGNVSEVVQETKILEGAGTGLTWRKSTVNTYQDNLDAWMLGRLTRSTVTSVAPTPEQQLQMHGAPNVGTSPHAAEVFSTMPPKGQTPPPSQISPAVLSAILQLLLED
ncbi:VCBS repeat-containing protein [Mitsuaria sp. GD03876]|uniref:FG-GAP repeat domain-containing protein n=1 Tax=Mitsuaria sp. GD03876 TaxID=2975399 RepID=UPI00244B3DF7|nr:VCBS repeat-containing protein [Mitsuaria sp. GD03876]MDH0865904.1 VCBS repeat-containing protein [Mitsuaria sp. GD03876]